MELKTLRKNNEMHQKSTRNTEKGNGNWEKEQKEWYNTGKLTQVNWEKKSKWKNDKNERIRKGTKINEVEDMK